MAVYSPGGLNLADTTAPLILGYDDTGSTDVVFSVSSSGNLTIEPDGGDTVIAGSGNLTIQTTAKVFIDGGSNTYIEEGTPDRFDVVAGGVTAFHVAESGGTVEVKSYGTLDVASDVTVAGNLNILAEADLRLQDASGGQYAGFDAPATVSSSYVLTMPTAVGGSGQALRASDGVGALEWYTPGDVGDITNVTAGAGMTGGGASGDVTLDVVGTSNRITANAHDIDIAATYVGQASLTTLGTVATGIWSAGALTTSGDVTLSATNKVNLSGTTYARESATNVLMLSTASTDRWKIDASGHLLTDGDNNYDIGGSGANRPRDVYIAGTTTGAAASFTTITASSTLSVDDTTDSTSTTTGSVHTDGGVGIAKDLVVGGDTIIGATATSGAAQLFVAGGSLKAHSRLHSTVTQGDGVEFGKLSMQGSGREVSIRSFYDHASSAYSGMSIYTDGAAGTGKALTIDSSQNVSLEATGKLYLDGGSNTYINEPAADQIDFFTGGGERLKITSSEFQIGTAANVAGAFVVSGTGPHSFGAAANGDYQVNWGGAYTATGGATLGLANFFSQTFTGAVGNTAWLATCAIAGVLNTQGTDTNIGVCSSLIVNAPNINNNLASSGKPDVASAVHIVGAPTEGDVNAALYVEAGDVMLPATGKLYLDGGSNTYINEPAADQIDFFTGGGERLKITSSQFQIGTAANVAGVLTTTGAITGSSDVSAKGANSGSSANRTAITAEGSGVSLMLANGSGVGSYATIHLKATDSAGTGGNAVSIVGAATAGATATTVNGSLTATGLLTVAKTGSSGNWGAVFTNNYDAASDVSIEMAYANSSGRNSGIGVNMDDATAGEYCMSLNSGGTNRFIVKGDGLVGIGASAPSSMCGATGFLEIAGSVVGLRLTDTSMTPSDWEFCVNNGPMGIYAESTGVSSMNFKQNGDVDIPNGLLTVTENVSIGTNPSSAGMIRFPKHFGIFCRNPENDGNRHVIGENNLVAEDVLDIGDNSAGTWTDIRFHAGAINCMTITAALITIDKPLSLPSEVRAGNLPTSAGTTGTLWSDSGTVKVA